MLPVLWITPQFSCRKICRIVVVNTSAQYLTQSEQAPLRPMVRAHPSSTNAPGLRVSIQIYHLRYTLYAKVCSCMPPNLCGENFLLLTTVQWSHYGYDGVSNHHRLDCLFKHLFRRRSKKTSKFRVTGLCVVNSPGTGEYHAQRASYAENVSIWWRHHDSAIHSGYLHLNLQYWDSFLLH